MNKEEALSLLKSLDAQFRAIGIRRVGLFGSAVRDESGPESDVDILLEFGKGMKTFDTFMDAVEILENAYPIHVDILTVESLSPRLASRILPEAEFHEIA